MAAEKKLPKVNRAMDKVIKTYLKNAHPLANKLIQPEVKEEEK